LHSEKLAEDIPGPVMKPDLAAIVDGKTDAIERPTQWLRHGPPLARVDDLVRESVADAIDCEGFTIG